MLDLGGVDSKALELAAADRERMELDFEDDDGVNTATALHTRLDALLSAIPSLAFSACFLRTPSPAVAPAEGADPELPPSKLAVCWANCCIGQVVAPQVVWEGKTFSRQQALVEAVRLLRQCNRVAEKEDRYWIHVALLVSQHAVHRRDKVDRQIAQMLTSSGVSAADVELALTFPPSSSQRQSLVARLKAFEEQQAKLKLEAQRRRKAEEEAARRREEESDRQIAQEAARKRLEEEAARKKRDEETAQRRRAEEAARKKREEEEEARRPHVPDIVKPVAPVVPVVPVVPVAPDVPEVPDVPDVPVKPDVPNIPVTPDVPAVPDVPVLVKPVVPVVPVKPSGPDDPSIPQVPVMPSLPVRPGIPIKPVAPVKPTEPVVVPSAVDVPAEPPLEDPSREIVARLKASGAQTKWEDPDFKGLKALYRDPAQSGKSEDPSWTKLVWLRPEDFAGGKKIQLFFFLVTFFMRAFVSVSLA